MSEPTVDGDSSQPAFLPLDLGAQLLHLQTQAWKIGEGPPIEQLLQQHPELCGQASLMLDLIHNEIYCRRRKGQLPQLTDYQQRFPGVAEDLKIQWEIDRLLFSNSPLDIDASATAFGFKNWDPQSSRAEVPSVVGSYEIQEPLGHGGMGAVYTARHQLLGKTVALKLLSQRVTGRPEVVERFRREMKAVGTLNHPHIVQAFDAGEINGIHYIAMELVVGIDLYRLIKERGPLPIPDACMAVSQIASALAAAHQVGLIHRDVKPSNIMLANRQIKLLDLGLALLLEEDGMSSEFTSISHTFGTPDFMAPEQWDNAHLVDHRADLYSLGCTLFYLVVGRPPFATSDYRTAPRKMRGHLLDSVPDLRSLRADVPDGVAVICNTLLAKSPDDRLATADALREAILPYAVGATIVKMGSISEATETVAPAGEPVHEQPSNRQSKTNEVLPSVLFRSKTAFSRSAFVGTLLICSLVLGYLWWDHLQAVISGDSPGPNPQSKANTSAEADRPGKLQNPDPSESEPSSSAVKSPPPDHDLLPVQTLEIWKGIVPAVVADGRFEDVKVNSQVVSMDASGLSRHLWLDFHQPNGIELTMRMDLRILNPQHEGWFKIIFLHDQKWSDEYYVQLRQRDGKSTLNVSYHDAAGQHVLAEIPLKLDSEAIGFEVTFTRELIAVSVDGKQLLSTPRTHRRLGTLAIAVGEWSVELTHPTAVIH